MIRRPPRSTRVRSSAASDVYKRQGLSGGSRIDPEPHAGCPRTPRRLSLIHISEPTRLLSISYAVFCLKKKKHPSSVGNDMVTMETGNTPIDAAKFSALVRYSAM